MTSFTTISNASLVVGEPITAPQGTALRDNPLAIAEGDTTAPVNQAVWHPYNKVANGDANTGLIYNFATNGAVTAIESPTFIAGFEYRMRWYLGFSATTEITVDAWNGSAWVVPDFSDPQTLTGSVHEGFYELNFGLKLLFNDSSGGEVFRLGHPSTQAAFPFTKMRIVRVAGGVTTASGRVWLDKRRAYAN